MKRTNIPKTALLLMVAGLLLTSLMPVVSRYFTLPDYLKGFLCGLGLALEFIALVKIQRVKISARCSAS